MQDTIEMGGMRVRFLQTNDSLNAFEMIVQPKGRMPVAHFHDRWEETIFALQGTTIWRIDGTDTPLPPGQSIHIRRGTVHGFRNDSDAPATCLCVLTPGVLGPDYFREIAAQLASDAPDPAQMREIMRRHGLVPVPE